MEAARIRKAVRAGPPSRSTGMRGRDPSVRGLVDEGVRCFYREGGSETDPGQRESGLGHPADRSASQTCGDPYGREVARPPLELVARAPLRGESAGDSDLYQKLVRFESGHERVPIESSEGNRTTAVRAYRIDLGPRSHEARG